MTSRLNALYLSGSLALSFFITKPVMADEWDKRTEFQFSAPVQIPGHVLAPGKYVFELLNTSSDRNIVEIFSEDAKGKESLVATLSTLPELAANPPDKSVLHFKELPAGAPEAIQSWFYPGDDTGWEFVYPTGKSLVAGVNTTPAPAPVATAPAAAVPAMAPATSVQQAQQTEPTPEITALEEQIFISQNDAPALPPAQEPDVPTDVQIDTAQALPQTGGNSDLELMTGFAMIGGGLVALFASRRKSMA